MIRRQRSELCVCQLRVDAAKDGHHWAGAAEGELQSAPGVDQPRGQVHQLLQHGPDAPALGALMRRDVRAEQTSLAEPAQDVVGEHSACEDQGVGGELPRGQALDVEVGLELAVVLLGGAVWSA